jgi:hypothetical protein
MIVIWQQQAFVSHYRDIFLCVFIRKCQRTLTDWNKDTVAKLTDHNSESYTDQSNSASRYKPPNSTKVSRVGQPLVHLQWKPRDLSCILKPVRSHLRPHAVCNYSSCKTQSIVYLHLASLWEAGSRLFRQDVSYVFINPNVYYRVQKGPKLYYHLNTELNPICHLLVLFGAHPILYVSRIRINTVHILIANFFVVQLTVMFRPKTT